MQLVETTIHSRSLYRLEAPTANVYVTGIDWDATDRELLEQVLGVSRLLGVRQVHGDAVVHGEDIERSPVCEADGILLAQPLPADTAYFVQTADCLPIVIGSSTKLCLVHAGWRGLSKGIVRKAARHFTGEDAQSIWCFVGPAAGGDAYEVGEDVVTATNGEAFAHPSDRDGKFLLSLSGLANRDLLSVFPSITPIHSGICTMSDSRFHSFRRSAGQNGRNLTLVTAR